MRWVAVVLLAAPLGCGGRLGPDVPDAGDAGVPDAAHHHDGSVITDASVADVATVDDAGSYDAGEIYPGRLTFYCDATQGGDSGTIGSGCSFDGQFFASAAAAIAGCTASGWGDCTLYECPVAGSPFGTLSAGTLTLDGPTEPSSGPSVTLGTQGYFAYYPTPFEDGDVFGVSASAGQVPAFTEQQITIPGMIALTSPTSPYSIPTTGDLTVTWTGGEAGARVFVDVEEDTTTKNDTTFGAICYFDAPSGSGIIPKGLLATFQGYGGGYLFWGHERHVVFTAGTYPIELIGRQYSYHPATFL